MWGFCRGPCGTHSRKAELMRVKRNIRSVDVMAGAFMLPALLVPLSANAGEVVSSASRALNANGSTSMNYSTSLDELGATFGLNMSAPPASIAPQPVPGVDSVSGTAYARVSLSRLPEWLMWQNGAVNLVINPTAEESRIGTNFSRSWVVTDGLKATLADSYAVTHRLSGDSSWKTDKSLSVKLENTGTTLSIATSVTDSAHNFQHRLSARQNIFGNLNVTTSLTDTGTSYDKSIRAGLSHRW